MSDPLKDISETEKIDGTKADQSNTNSAERSNRTEDRINDLIGKVKSTSDSLEVEKKARKEAEFELGFERQAKVYPAAPEFKDKVKQQVEQGIPLETALIAELHKANKLMNTQDISKEKLSNDAIGGSADIKGVAEKVNKPNSELSSQEMRAKLVEMESRGEVKLT